MPNKSKRLAQGNAADGDRVDQVDALRTVGDIDRRVEVVEKDADDLAEAQGDDGEVVAAQAQGRRAQQHAEQPGDQRPERQYEPDRQVQAELRRSQQGIKIGADRVEGDIAQIEQAGVADHDIEPQRQHDVEQGEVEDAHPAVAQSGTHQEGRSREQQAEQDKRDQRNAAVGFQTLPVHGRSATRSPSKPEGRNTSTPISTKKANTSW